MGRAKQNNGGRRADLDGLYVRSKWEANVARWLKWMEAQGEIQGWAYEPEIFRFEGVKRNPISYTPDFKVIDADGSIFYYEVKGWMDSMSKSKLKRMAKFYPDVKILVIDEAFMKGLRAFAGLIEGWE